MLSRILLPLFLVSLSSCALFKSQNIQNQKFETLISYIQAEGEGKGRLGINQQKYLISFEAVLKENQDWLLAAAIPLHGEEVLLLKDLKQEKVIEGEEDGLELRIERGISEYLKSQKQSPATAKSFMLELRRLMRIVLHKKLKLDLSCSSTECQMGEAIYQVKADSKQITLKKSLSADYEIELVATNLTDSIFKRSSIFLHSKNKNSANPTLLSIELFW